MLNLSQDPKFQLKDDETLWFMGRNSHNLQAKKFKPVGKVTRLANEIVTNYLPKLEGFQRQAGEENYIFKNFKSLNQEELQSPKGQIQKGIKDFIEQLGNQNKKLKLNVRISDYLEIPEKKEMGVFFYSISTN